MLAIPRVTPGSGPLAAVGQIWATLRAELMMQWRRWGLWLTFAGAAALLVLLTRRPVYLPGVLSHAILSLLRIPN